MCGRFGLSEPEDVASRFQAELLPEFSESSSPLLTPRFNIAPSQDVLVVARSREGEKVVRPMRWGLVPFWTKDPARAPRSINLRAQNVFERPSFRGLLERRRCIIPADGFYEWQKAGARKQPWHFGLRGGRTFGFAGLWDYWRRGEDTLITCTILTTEPNDLVVPIHDRMPVILAEQNEALWLDSSVRELDALRHCTTPLPPDVMEAFPVVPLVNDVRNEGAELRQRLDAAGGGPVQQALLL